MNKIKHILTVLFLSFLSTFSIAQQIEMIPLPPQVASFCCNTRGFWFTAPTDFTIIALRVPTTVNTGPQSIAVVTFTGNVPPPAFPGTTNAYTTQFYVSNDPSLTEISVNIPITAGQVVGVYGSRNGNNSYGPNGPFNTTLFGFPITLTRSGVQTNIATTWPFPIWTESAFQVSRVEVTCQMGGGGGGGSEHCVPNDCLLVTCPPDVTVACIEDYEADPNNAMATFNCVDENGSTAEFEYTGDFQTWTVPAGVTRVLIETWGAQGHSNAGGGGTIVAGGLGGYASGQLNVSPGNILYIYVGGGGTQNVNGGFNGGGVAGTHPNAACRGGGGGGATDVRLNSQALSARVLVAGGGGGAGGNRVQSLGRGGGGGGGGGYYGGGGGAGYPASVSTTLVPKGGTQTAGGAGGISNFSALNNGLPGTLGVGGNGGPEVASAQGSPSNAARVGGVGGGLMGGNGLYATTNNFTGQSGAGGSGYIGGVLNGSMEDGVQMGNGRVVISGFYDGGGSAFGEEAFRYVDPPHATGAANCPETVYEIVYHVGDNLGNVGCCVQLVTIANAAPTLTVAPGETVSCYDDINIVTGSDVPNDDVEVTSSCGQGYEIKILPPVVNGIHECPGTTYTYAYRVRDICGREVIANRVFTIGNNPAPTIVAPPDMTVACGYFAEINPAYAEVTTGCTLGYTTTVTGPTVTGTDNCPGATYTYTYTVTDECGRTASDTRKFTVANTAPVFLTCPSVPLIINCEDDGWQQIIQAWLASVTAESSCGTALNVTNNYNPNTQGLCINNGTRTVRWMATDNCGRTSICEQMLIVADTEPPVFVTAPQNELVVCNYITQDKLDAWVDAHGNAVVDDCWSNITWTTTPNNPTINCGGNPGPTSLTVTFIATDGCGNKSSMDATFTALPAIGIGGSNEEDLTEESLQLFQNQPNPFNDQTTISFYLPEATKAILSIYDVSGKLLKEIKGDYSEGMNMEEISRSDLQGAGLLYYKLSTEKETATRRMILLD